MEGSDFEILISRIFSASEYNQRAMKKGMAEGQVPETFGKVDAIADFEECVTGHSGFTQGSHNKKEGHTFTCTNQKIGNMKIESFMGVVKRSAEGRFASFVCRVQVNACVSDVYGFMSPSQSDWKIYSNTRFEVSLCTVKRPLTEKVSLPVCAKQLSKKRAQPLIECKETDPNVLLNKFLAKMKQKRFVHNNVSKRVKFEETLKGFSNLLRFVQKLDGYSQARMLKDRELRWSKLERESFNNPELYFSNSFMHPLTRTYNLIRARELGLRQDPPKRVPHDGTGFLDYCVNLMQEVCTKFAQNARECPASEM